MRLLWTGPELNRRHTAFQAVALPTELPVLVYIYLKYKFIHYLSIVKHVFFESLVCNSVCNFS